MVGLFVKLPKVAAILLVDSTSDLVVLDSSTASAIQMGQAKVDVAAPTEQAIVRWVLLSEVARAAAVAPWELSRLCVIQMVVAMVEIVAGKVVRQEENQQAAPPSHNYYKSSPDLEVRYHSNDRA